ncbi:uncharacterized protein [Montipora capricornis]|uniref:uncharacterized protein n=1 Tax=Montipora capricornis TaxID=246305 RepID=UPI0035F17727
MTNMSCKQKTCGAPTQLLPANVSNLTFEFLPSSGSKGKSPAIASRSVNIYPDLDLIGGFAFLSFASLEHLEDHIEQNEGNLTVVSVNVGKKRKAEDYNKPQANNSELQCPPSKKKSAAGKKKASVKVSSVHSTNVSSTSKAEDTPIGAKHKAATVVEKQPPGKTDTSRSSENTTSQDFPSSDLEISLLCCETVDLVDEEEILEEGAYTGKEENSLGHRVYDDTEDELAVSSSTHLDDNVGINGSSTMGCNSRPKRKKKKRRASEHCDQTSQTKFRIKKKKKPVAKGHNLQESSHAGKFESGPPSDSAIQETENLPGKAGKVKNDRNETPSQPKIERITCARTSCYLATSKSNNNLKSKFSGLGLSHGSNSTTEQIQLKTIDKSSSDVCTPNSSDREVDVGDETRSVSVLSDFSDHSSDIEPFDTHGCFLLNNKIDKVEKENYQDGDEELDVDVETVAREASKNFLVVSGIEAGHFSYHPGATSEGTIDTSIQALPNEIDIFLHCAKIQEGQIIKIINPDECLEFHPHVLPRSLRKPADVKATRSATERRRRHRLGDLFGDMKKEVFTNAYESDLYFSKQAILSKAISTLDELETELANLTNTRVQLLKQNKQLRKSRNKLIFGKSSVDVDDVKAEAILKHLNISVDEVEQECANKGPGHENEVNKDKQGEETESSVKVVEPSAKGRPRANKSLMPTCLLKPTVRSKADANGSDARVAERPQCPLETPKMSDSPKDPSPPKRASNVSCGVQTPSFGSVSKSSGLKNSDISPHAESVRQENGQPSFACDSPKVIHTVTCTSTAQVGMASNEIVKSDTLKPGLEKCTPVQTLWTNDPTKHASSPDQQPNQEGAKPSVLKILPKPAILHLNPTQQKAIMESLGQIKQPSSDKIICNLSRLSTQTNPNAPRICIIRSSGQLVKSLDSKNVMHIQITNDALKSLDTSSSSAVSGATGTSLSSQTISGSQSGGSDQNPQAPMSSTALPTVNVDKRPVFPTSSAQVLSVSSLPKPVVMASTTQIPSVIGTQKPLVLTSSTQIPLVGTVQKITIPTSTQQIISVAGTEKPVVLSSAVLTGAQKFVVHTSTPQILSVVNGQRLKMPISSGQLSEKYPKQSNPPPETTLTNLTITPQMPHGEQRKLSMTKSLLQGTPGKSQTSVDVTLRALAALNQLQANNPAPPSLTETVTNPLVPNESSGSGSLVGLRNVVMKVGSKEHISTPCVKFPMIALTSVKTNTTRQMTVASSSAMTCKQCAVTNVCPVAFGSPKVLLPLSSSVSAPSSTSLDTSVPSTIVPTISVPSSTSLNKSFTVSASISPNVININSNLDAVSQPFIGPCLDPLSFLPGELATSTATITSKQSSLSSVGGEKQVNKEAPDSNSSTSPSFGQCDVFNPESSISSTVLTQEMLKIPGINQSPKESTLLLKPSDLPLTDVFPDLAEIDSLVSHITSVSATDPLSCGNKGTADKSDRPNPREQTYSLRSSAVSIKQSSPLKATTRDSKKGKSPSKT